MLFDKVIDTVPRIYGAGILFSSINELRNTNISINEKIKQGSSFNNFDYTKFSLMGLFEGTVIGLVWPITVFGRVLGSTDFNTENNNK